MWCDDFDMDLPKVFPEAREIVGDLADIELWTTGHETNGTLNHPDVWNGDTTMLAFFGFRDPARDMTFYVGSGSPVRCTAWEVFRDAWPHSYGLHVEQYLIWDTLQLRRQFETIMYDLRKWSRAPAKELARARSGVMRSLKTAVDEFRRVADRHAGSVRRLQPSQIEE